MISQCNHFVEQFKKYQHDITIADGRNITGVQVTPVTFVDSDMRKYYHESEDTILTKAIDKHWVFAEYVFSVIGTSMLKGYVEKKSEDDNTINLVIIEDCNNETSDLLLHLQDHADILGIDNMVRRHNIYKYDFMMTYNVSKKEKEPLKLDVKQHRDTKEPLKLDTKQHQVTPKKLTNKPQKVEVSDALKKRTSLKLRPDTQTSDDKPSRKKLAKPNLETHKTRPLEEIQKDVGSGDMNDNKEN